MECGNTESGFDVKINNSPAYAVGRTSEKGKTPSESTSKRSPKVMNSTEKTRSERPVKPSPVRPTLTHSAPLRARSAQTPKSAESRSTTGTPSITVPQTSIVKSKPHTYSQGKVSNDSKPSSARKTTETSTAIARKPTKTKVPGVASKPQKVASALQPAKESKCPESVKLEAKISSSKEINEPLKGKKDPVKVKFNSSTVATPKPTIASAAKRTDVTPKSVALKANEARYSKNFGSKTSQPPSMLEKSKENARIVKKTEISGSPSSKTSAKSATSTSTKLNFAKPEPLARATGKLSATKGASAGKGHSAKVAKPTAGVATESAKKSPKTTTAGASTNDQISSVTTLSDLACKALPLISELSSAEAARRNREYEVSVAPYEARGAIVSPELQVPRPADDTLTDVNLIAAEKAIVEVNAVSEDLVGVLMDTVNTNGQREFAVSSAVDVSTKNPIAAEAAVYEQIQDKDPENARIGNESELNDDETKAFKESVVISNETAGLDTECQGGHSFYAIHNDSLKMERSLIDDETQVIKVTDTFEHQTSMTLHGENFSQLSTDATCLNGDLWQQHRESLSSVEKLESQGGKVFEGSGECQEDDESTVSILAMADGVNQYDFSQWAVASEVSELVSEQNDSIPGNDCQGININSSESDDFETGSSHDVVRENKDLCEASDELCLECSGFELDMKPRTQESFQHPDSCLHDKHADNSSTSKGVTAFQDIFSFKVRETDSMESMRPYDDHEILFDASDIGKDGHGRQELRLDRDPNEISYDDYIPASATSHEKRNAHKLEDITGETEQSGETEKSSLDKSAFDGGEGEENQHFRLTTMIQESCDWTTSRETKQFFDEAKGKGIADRNAGAEVLFTQVHQSNDESLNAFTTEDRLAAVKELPEFSQGTNEQAHDIDYNTLGTPMHSRGDVVGVTFGDLPEPTYVGARKYDIDCDDMYRVTPLDDFRYDSDNLTPSDFQSPAASPVRYYSGECDLEPSHESIDLSYDLTTPISDVGEESMAGHMDYVPFKGDEMGDITEFGEEDVRNVCIDFANTSMQTETISDQNDAIDDSMENYGLVGPAECLLNTSDYDTAQEPHKESANHPETASAFEFNDLSLEQRNRVFYSDQECKTLAWSKCEHAEDSSKRTNEPTAEQKAEQISKLQPSCYTDVHRAAVLDTDTTEDPHWPRNDDLTTKDSDSQGAYNPEPSRLSISKPFEILSDAHVSQHDDCSSGAAEFILSEPTHVDVASEPILLGGFQEQQTTTQKFASKVEGIAEDDDHGVAHGEDAEMNFEDREECAQTDDNVCDSKGREIHALSLDCVSRSSTHQERDSEDSCHSLPLCDRAGVLSMDVGMLSSPEVDDGIILDTETGNEVGQDIHYVDGRYAMGSYGSPTIIADVSSDSDIGEETEPDEFPDEYTDGLANSAGSSYDLKHGEVEDTEGGRVVCAGCEEEREDDLYSQAHTT